MTPEQKIRATVLVNLGLIPSDNVEINYEDFEDEDDKHYDEIYDALSDFRGGEVETDIPCEWSRHYETKSVAAKMYDGTWVGWTYWYGGGKHGEPESIDWMPSAYFLDVKEEEKMMVIRTFTKKENNNE